MNYFLNLKDGYLTLNLWRGTTALGTTQEDILEVFLTSDNLEDEDLSADIESVNEVLKFLADNSEKFSYDQKINMEEALEEMLESDD